ncbi:MAG: HIT domain-containing protein [Thermomicrobiales bacterium]
MERLWTPWRMTYVGGDDRSGAECVFCALPAFGNDVDCLIVERGPSAFMMLNLFPYNTGHLLVVPDDHVAELDELPAERLTDVMTLTQRAVGAVRCAMGNAGFNLGMNLGDVAGAGIADHLHLHIVPRWSGDANFMPIVAGTKVLPELLPATYGKIRAELNRSRVIREDMVVICFDRTARSVLLCAAHTCIPRFRIAESDPRPVWRQAQSQLDLASADVVLAGWGGSERAVSRAGTVGLTFSGVPAIDPPRGLRWFSLEEAITQLDAGDIALLDRYGASVATSQ